jgi:hypothetical protein
LGGGRGGGGGGVDIDGGGSKVVRRKVIYAGPERSRTTEGGIRLKRRRWTR